VKGSINEVRGKGEPVKEKSKAEPPNKPTTSEGDESEKQPAA